MAAAMDPCPLKFAPPVVIPSNTATRSVMSVTLSGHGDFDKVKFEKAALPVRLRGEMLEVEVYYGGLNFTDNYLRLGIVKSDTFPVIMGSECTGIIKRVGAGVTDFQAGQAVLCLRMQGGLFRRMVHVPPKNCFRLPSTESLVEAVGLGFNYLLAYLCLQWFGKLQAGQIVFMQSVGGGVGTAVVQVAKSLGVKVIGTASKFKHEKLLSLGVTRIYSDEEDYVEGILQEYPNGIDAAINSSGGADLEKCAKLLKPFGRLICIGSNNSVTPDKPPCWLRGQKPTWDSGDVSSAEIVRKNILVTGVNAGEFLENNAQAAKCILDQAFRQHAIRKIRPVVETYFPPSQVAEALRRLMSRKTYGKVVLLIRH